MKMICPDTEDDTISDLSTTHSTTATPSTSYTIAGSPWRDSYDIPPSPGYRYVIKIKSTDRAITLTRDGLCLQDTKHGHDASNRWLCVEQGIWLGFYNEESRVFIGHDSKSNVRATATVLRDWELLQARLHRSGGYELLSPHWVYWKQIINAADNGTKLVRTEHGHTLWVFEECERNDAAEFTPK